MAQFTGVPAIRVLLADDTRDMRTLLRVRLESDGRFEVVGEAENGAEAIRLADETKPDAIVLDLAMPVMDGLQALPELRRSVPNAKIVILSGFNATEVAEEALTLGADAYLEKGAAFSHLVALLLEPPSGTPSSAPESPSDHPQRIPGADADTPLRVVRDRPSEVDADALAQGAATAVTGAAHFAAAFERFATLVEGVVSFDRASFWMAGPNGESFECVATHDRVQGRLPVGATMAVTGRARRVLDGQPVVEPDTATDAEDGTNGALHANGIRSYVSLPLVIAGETKALINFSSSRPESFSREHTSLLERLVRETASTLHLLSLLDREREAGSRLREAGELKNDLVGIVAHDLRSPMTVISGYAQHMKDSWAELEEDKKLEFLESISRNVDDVARLVEDMLEVASFDSGKIFCDIEPFDLGEMVRATVTELAVAHLERTCTMSLPEDLPRALGDVRRQRQILANLICNALKFSPPPHPVELIVALDGECALISVRDQGCGIAPEHMARVFEKFYRVTGDGRPKTPGRGLGLYICKLLVEAQGGRIWAESEPGVGSTFTYTVRVMEAHSVSSETAPGTAA